MAVLTRPPWVNPRERPNRERLRRTSSRSHSSSNKLWECRTGTKRLGAIFGRLGTYDLMRVHYFLDQFWRVLWDQFWGRNRPKRSLDESKTPNKSFKVVRAIIIPRDCLFFRATSWCFVSCNPLLKFAADTERMVCSHCVYTSTCINQLYL